MKPLFRFGLIALAVLGTTASAEMARAADPIRVGLTFLTSGVDPTKGSNGWALISHGVGEKLFTVDQTGKLVPQLAAKADKTDNNNWTVTLASGRKFSDGSEVTAEAVTKGLANTIENNPTARATGGKLTFAVVDPLTFKVTTEKPVALLPALFAEWPLVIYKLQADGSAVFTGPYRISGFVADQGLNLEPNQYYPGAEKRSPVSIRKFSDAQSLALTFEAGQLDLAFGLPSEVVPRLKQNAAVSIKSFPVAYQYMALVNTKKPQLGDPRVRRALDIGIDRSQIALAINNGSPATGAYAAYFPFASKTARAFDLNAAKALLDDAGWKPRTDGVRVKDGQPLTIEVLAYPQRPDLVSMLPVLRAQLRTLGFDAQTRVVDNVGQVGSSGNFDVLLYATHTAPSGDPAFFLNGFVRSGASLNYSGYNSADFDAILDKLAVEGDAAKRIDLAHQAEQKIFADAPIVFLITPDWYVGVSRRLANYQPWGADYDVVRPDMGESS